MDASQSGTRKAKSADDLDRSKVVEQNFFRFLSGTYSIGVDLSPPTALNQQHYIDCFESQLLSRHCDLLERQLKQQNKGYYTIASCGHEGNAAISKVFRHTDMAFLHYRSAALMLQRAKAISEIDMVQDIVLSMLAAQEEPIAGGRHKVFGSVPLFVPPQTSTIASHLPKAVGCAASITRAATLKIKSKLAEDSVVLCSFGDASMNHAVALSALNTARWITHKRLPLPLVFICEDNGLGVSVPIPDDWVQSMVEPLVGIEYIQVNGLDLDAVYQASVKAERIARVERRPVFLHLKMVRLLGHAGNDFELGYRSLAQVEMAEKKDPLIYSAAVIQQQQWLTADEIGALYESTKARVHATYNKVSEAQCHTDLTTLMEPIIPPSKKTSVFALPHDDERVQWYPEKVAKSKQALTMGQQLNMALHDLLLQYPQLIVMGEDVGNKGGVYGITQQLQSCFGIARVFDTLLDETTIFGQAIGHAHNGFIPMPEIQFLAYLHNAEDQLRGEAATLSFFSQGQYTNPMVIRIASFGYQKGFGGHFHNENSFAVLRDIPGIIIACPSNGGDAVKMLRQAVNLAYQEQRIVVFLEPIALYAQKDLHQPQDKGWMGIYPDLNQTIALGEMGWYPAENNADTIVLTYGNGFYFTRQAQAILQSQYQVEIAILDLRWLKPLNEKGIVNKVSQFKRVVIVDECRSTGSLSEQLVTLLQQELVQLPEIKLIVAADCFVPLGPAHESVLPSVKKIVDCIVV